MGSLDRSGTRVPEVEAKLRKLVALFPRVTLLEPGVIGASGDRRVVGATLWFPPHFAAPYAGDPSDDMSDFSAIKGFRPWVIRKNGEHVQWPTRVLCNPFGYPEEENTGYRTLVLDGSVLPDMDAARGQ